MSEIFVCILLVILVFLNDCVCSLAYIERILSRYIKGNLGYGELEWSGVELDHSVSCR